MPRNYLAHVGHGLLGQTGFRLIQAPTFIPYYLHGLSGGSDLVVGLARGLQGLAQCLTPVLSATLIEHRRRVLPLGFAVGAAMRLQVLGIALAGFLLPREWALIATCTFLTFFGFFMGMQGVIFNFLMSKVIPVERRGVLTGLRNAFAGLTAAGVAYLGGRYFIDDDAFGNGYATVFLVGFVLTSLGLAVLAFIREPESPEVRERASVRSRLADLPGLLRSDRDFTAYFLARACATMGRMAMPYYALYAGTVMDVGGTELGILTAAFQLAQTTTNLAWGLIADRTGFRLTFISAIGVWIFSVILLMQAETFPALILAFVGIGAGLGGFMLSSQNLVLEFGSRQNLPMRIAVANSAAELMGGLGPLLGGVLAFQFSYLPLLWTAIVFKLAAIAVAVVYVRDPRHRNSAPAGQ